MRLILLSLYFLILLAYQDKEYNHRGCIQNEKQGKLKFDLACKKNYNDFRRPDGTVRYFVLLIEKF